MTRLIQRWMTDAARIERKPPQRAEFPAAIHGRRYRLAGGGRRRPRGSVGAGRASPVPTRLEGIWGRAVPAAGGASRLRTSTICAGRRAIGKIRVSVQHTQARQVSIGERRVAGPARPARLSARGHGSSRTARRPAGGVSHQRGRHRDAVASGGLRGDHQRTHLIPVLEAMLHQFPFRILGFHCDNGSEFLNHTVVKLLNKLLVEEFTKSRAYRTTDNALVEGKNGAVVRKQIGYGAIATEHAEALQKFYTALLQPVSELPPSLRIRYRRRPTGAASANGYIVTRTTGRLTRN